VVDSINPSALLAAIVLLLRGRSARPLVAVYVAAVLVTYFAIGLALTLGLGLTPEAVTQSDAAYLAQGVFGAAMLAHAVLAPGRGRQRQPATSRKLPAVRRPAAVFALGWPSPSSSCRAPCPTWARSEPPAPTWPSGLAAACWPPTT
jgi:hypothetical protein